MIKVSISVETKVGKKRVIVIHKKIADAVGLREGQRIRITVEGGKTHCNYINMFTSIQTNSSPF